MYGALPLHCRGRFYSFAFPSVSRHRGGGLRAKITSPVQACFQGGLEYHRFQKGLYLGGLVMSSIALNLRNKDDVVWLSSKRRDVLDCRQRKSCHISLPSDRNRHRQNAWEATTDLTTRFLTLVAWGGGCKPGKELRSWHTFPQNNSISYLIS